jgi:dipeptidyl aminopeptidase/acylaminoacyl peptidase
VGKNQHVVPVDGRWGVRGEGNTRLTALFDRQSEAINTARQISRNQHSELFIHGADDDLILPKNSEDMSNRTKGISKLCIIPGAGHAMSILTEPEMYADTVKTFLSELSN